MQFVMLFFQQRIQERQTPVPDRLVKLRPAQPVDLNQNQSSFGCRGGRPPQPQQPNRPFTW